MLYELIGIVRINNHLHRSLETKELVGTIGKLIIQNRGVVRDIVNMGERQLPQIMRKDQERHFRGFHFMMLFDASSGVQNEILRTLKKDPRVIRSSIVKVNTKRSLDVAASLDRANNIPTIFDKVLAKTDMHNSNSTQLY